MPSINEIRSITDSYESCGLESDGLSRILFRLLSDAFPDADIQLCAGMIIDYYTYNGYSPHYWLEVNTDDEILLVDYCARRWLGDNDNIPYGVFSPTLLNNFDYDGAATGEAPVNDFILQTLLTDC